MAQPPRQIYEFQEGTVIANRYQVVRQVGCGGMGLVVQVVDRALDNDVLALKLLYPQHVRDQTVFARFRREVLLARRLSHPNIVQLYDFGSAGKGYYFISMEYVDGVNLSKKIYAPKDERITFGGCLKVLKQVADGIAEAHRQNIVHRDLKPDNIIVGINGEVKITDFGLARGLTSDQNLTQTGEAVGTPYYMSPEQIRGDVVDQRSDIYSLGIIGFELVAGYRPFQHDVWLNLATMHLTEPIPNICTEESSIPQWYQEFLEIAAAKDRDDRFHSVEEFSAEIAKHLDDTSSKSLRSLSSSPAPTASRKNRKAKSAWFRWGVSAAVVFFSIVLMVALLPRLLSPIGNAATQFTLSLEQNSGHELPVLRAFLGVEPKASLDGFVEALLAGNKDKVKNHLWAGIDPDYSFKGKPALFHLIERNSNELIPVMLEGGADPNIELDDGTSPLLLAVKNNNLEAATQLTAFNADVNRRNSKGQSPLHLAAANDNADITAMLLQHSAIVDNVDGEGATPLAAAARNNSFKTAQTLVQHGANPNIQDRSKNTPLHYATTNRNSAIAKLLLDHGASAGIRNKDGKDSFEVARDLNVNQILMLVRKHSQKRRRAFGRMERREPPADKPSVESDSSNSQQTRLRPLGRPQAEIVGTELKNVTLEVRNFGQSEAKGIRVSMKLPDGGSIDLEGPGELTPNAKAAYTASPGIPFAGGKLKPRVICDNCYR